jgi:hypothetical protein
MAAKETKPGARDADASRGMSFFPFISYFSNVYLLLDYAYGHHRTTHSKPGYDDGHR